ncbi:MAG: hypothetical protein KKF30_07515 [Proteobacteria bacterium]|nr:hypothetical protein [Pseudomonadota bacterium]MBU4470284.1 hypothetical protein [Pseudomonadota bacterium]MCG2752697.1 hypothetical protein [Desulfobacteraceae bacterium]
MANREACELYIEQEIKESLAEGKKPHSIGHELAVWIEKVFEVSIKPDTLKKRAQRIEKNIGTNVPKQSKPTEFIENPTTEIIKNRHPQGGGAREGAGRPPVTPPVTPPTEEVYVRTSTQAMQFVSIAISQLERIRIEDPKRIEALNKVKSWIEQQLKL